MSIAVPLRRVSLPRISVGMWTLAGAARGAHISNSLVSLHRRDFSILSLFSSNNPGSSDNELRRRAAQVVSRLCVDVALPINGDECLQTIEDEPETEQMLRPVSEREESV
jgi:hypothetical protein